MKILAPIFLFILFSSCNGQSNKGDEEMGLPVFDALQVDSIVQSLNETTEVSEEKSAERKHLLDLLESPLNLVDYKTEYGTSNSGNRKAEALFLMPDTVGFYYQYMLFHKLRNVLESHPSESDLFRDFRILVYKYGEEIGGFYDTNEELIAIECAMKNETLGELDLFGMGKNEVEEKLGVPDRVSIMQAIYFAEQTVLTLHYTGADDIPDDRIKVDWFKIVRVNQSFSLSEKIPSYLLNFE